MAAMLMLSAFAATVQAQQKVFNDNQNKTNMESNTIRLTIEGGVGQRGCQGNALIGITGRR